MVKISKSTRTIEGVQPGNIPTEVIQSCEPIILKGLVSDWPLVNSAQKSDRSAVDYLKSFYNGRTTLVCKLEPEQKGRMFYNEALTKLGYSSYKGRIDETLELIYTLINEDEPPGYYIASNIIDTHLPGFNQKNNISIPRLMSPDVDKETISIWIGNKTTATCHYDALDNIACCVVGKRRFTLFPPEQVDNLYPGPLDPTPGGQVISLVDFTNPDYEQFPKFKHALEVAQVAELDVGDALFLPSMWWHHVESLTPFNVLVNYWWNDAPRYMTSGMTALYAAMLGIRDKPKHEREGWKALFDYYIFDGAKPASSKLPPEARGFLETIDSTNSRKLRTMLTNRLNR